MQNSVLLGILMTLLGNKQVTSAQLAEKYEVSRRTIFRYVDVLCQAEIPIYANPGRHGGFGIIDSYKMTSTFFTPTEYNCLLSAVKSYSQKDAVATLLLDKLNALSRPQIPDNYLATDQLVVEMSVTPALLGNILVLKNAICKSLVVNIDYQYEDTSARRQILPHTILYRNAIWYVNAYCRSKQDFRLFVINRIKLINTTDEIFTPQQGNIIKSISTQLPAVVKAEEFYISFTQDVLSEIEDWLGTDAIMHTRAGLVAVATLPIDRALVARILTFGNSVKVESPDRLKIAIIKTITQSLDNYK
ncbi:MAG: YafY family protein [Clostridia bacterium]|nr:YafY family protein [Clostridia bacterium]